MAAGTVMQMKGQMDAGKAQKHAADAQARGMAHQASLQRAEAAQVRVKAGQDKAALQRKALDERRRGNRVSSRALAVMAASGGGAFDPSAIDLLSDIETETDLRVGTALHDSMVRENELNFRAEMIEHGAIGTDYQAAVTRHQGETAQRLATSKAIGTGIGFAGKAVAGGAFSKFNTDDSYISSVMDDDGFTRHGGYSEWG